MKIYRVIGVAMLLALLLFSSVRTTQAAPAKQTGPMTWTVLVGAEAMVEDGEHGPAGAWQMLKFYPSELTINAGDTVIFKANNHYVHNVMFPVPLESAPAVTLVQPAPAGPPTILLNPAVIYPAGRNSFDGSATAGSGNLSMAEGGAKEFSLTFAKAGSFDYLCNYHGAYNPGAKRLVGHVGRIIVQDAGAAYPRTQAQIDSDAAAAIAADTDKATAEMSQATAMAAVPNTDGTTNYTINAGYMVSNDPLIEYLRFGVKDLKIKAGDTVTWKIMGFHNVLFPSGVDEPPLAIPQGPDAQGRPNLVFNPLAGAPSGGKVHTGKGLYNSGLPQDEGMTPRSYSLIFNAAGKYEYICSPHDEVGMVAFITVEGAATPNLPQTGQSDGLGWLLLIGFGLLAVGLFGRLATHLRRA